MTETWILGTRGSPLARTQSEAVRVALQEALGDVEIETRIIKTEGDRLQTTPLAPGEKLAKGLFTSALEEALLGGEIDLAVHSLKDVPTAITDRLRIAAIPAREDCRDAFLSNGPSLAALPAGAKIGTGSPRRAMQLRLLRPDLDILPIRGNVDTRIGKLRSGEFDGIVLAVAGLKRLDLLGEVTEPFHPETILPAPGQGALGVEMRDDDKSRRVTALFDDAETRAMVTAEREVLIGIGGGCDLPLGTWGRIEQGELLLSAILCDESGRAFRASGVGAPSEAVAIGKEVARRLLEASHR